MPRPLPAKRGPSSSKNAMTICDRTSHQTSHPPRNWSAPVSQPLSTTLILQLYIIERCVLHCVRSFHSLCPSSDDSLETDLQKVNKISRCPSEPRHTPTVFAIVTKLSTKTPNIPVRPPRKTNCNPTALSHCKTIYTIPPSDRPEPRVMRRPIPRPQT